MKTTVTDFSRITAILRGYSPEEVRLIARLLCDSQIRSVEITLNTPGAQEMIRNTLREFGSQLAVGAGTVMTMEELQEVIKSQVDFVLSPVMFSQEMLELCKSQGVISVPGAMSPTEIRQSFLWGADIVKVFPAITVGPSYFKQLAGPMGSQPLMAVGGITAGNAQEFFRGGASFLGIGSGILRREDVAAGNVEKLKEQLRAFETALGTGGKGLI